MEKKKNALTLVELIAIIAIIGIISIIVTPIILKTVKNTRIYTFKTNVSQIINEAKKQYTLENFDKNVKSITFSNISNKPNEIKLESDINYNYKILLFFNKEENEVSGYFAIDDKDSLSAHGKIPSDEIIVNQKFLPSNKIVFTENGITSIEETNKDFYESIICDSSIGKKGYITYEDFYAIGDGKTNDGYAIYYAHACANALQIPIKANKNDYYISELPDNKPIQIKTNVNWNNSTIIVDDGINRNIRKKTIFEIPGNKISETQLSFVNLEEIIDYIKVQNANAMNSTFYIGLISNEEKIYRLGSETEIFAKSDYFKIDNSGNLKNNIRYEFENTDTVNVKIFEIPEETLILKNLNFISIDTSVETVKDLNNTYNEVGKRFYITRSNVEINNLNHYLIDNDIPTFYGGGFLSINEASDIIIKNSNFRAHMYQHDDYSGASSGTYEISIWNSANITFDSIGYTCNENESIKTCYNKNVINPKYWGMTGTNNNKNWIIKNSTLNRIDSHMPSDDIYVSSSIIGNHAITVTGSGNLNVVDSSFDHSEYFVMLRNDFGSTWNGNIKLNNIYFNSKTYDDNNSKNPTILTYSTPAINNEGNFHDFGYSTYIPSINASNIIINEENLARTSSGIDLVRNTSKNTISVFANNLDLKPSLIGNMSFNNIRSENFDKLKIDHVFTGNDGPNNYTTIFNNNIVTYFNRYGLDKMNINYYQNYKPINITIDTSFLSNTSFETYYKDYYECDNICDNKGNNWCYNEENNECKKQESANAINISTTSTNSPYCEIIVKEQKQDDWYNSDSLNITLKISNSDNIIDYGLGYSTSYYNKTTEMIIPNSKKGVFNIYGYVTDDKGKTYNCIKLIKKNN